MYNNIHIGEIIRIILKQSSYQRKDLISHAINRARKQTQNPTIHPLILTDGLDNWVIDFVGLG